MKLDTTFFSSNAFYCSAAAALCIGSMVHVLRQRKKRLLKIEKTKETFHAIRNTSWLSLTNLTRLGLMRSTSKDTHTSVAMGKSSLAANTALHPEGPHIGYDSNSSWYVDRRKGVPGEASDHRSGKVDVSHGNGFYNTDSNYIKSENKKLVVVMVGLPSSGKTYIARKIARYLRWIGLRTRAFSLAKYRLDKLGTKTADFFDPSSATNYNQRVALLIDALDDTLRYLSRGGDISILDGTNTTRDRRKVIIDKIAAHSNDYEILWIEILQSSPGGCSADEGDRGDVTSPFEGTDTAYGSPLPKGSGGDSATSSSSTQHQSLTSKQLAELAQSPDFLDKEDYEKRMNHYRSTYQSLENDEGSFIKFISGEGKTLVLHDIFGFLRSKIVSFVMNINSGSKPVFITRHGESDFNIKGLIGGDCGLTQRGRLFAKTLGDFMMTDELSTEDAKRLRVWTSTMRRARETASDMRLDSHYYSNKVSELRNLREIEVGICDGLSYEQVKQMFPEEYEARQTDKLRYRYPRGESYMDVITRLEPVIFEIERLSDPVLIIAHQAVLRCLYAYFLDLPAEEIPYLSIPLHTIIRLDKKAYGCKEKRFRLANSS